MEIENKLKEMGLELPVSPTPAAHRAAAVRTGNVVFVGGHRARMLEAPCFIRSSLAGT